MFFCCAFKDKLFLESIQNSSESDILSQAYKLFQKDNFVEGHKLIDDLVSQNHPLALVLSSMFSKDGENEDQFHNRHIELIKIAVSAKEPCALYSLGVYYDTGNFFELDKQKAFEYFKESAELKMPQAEHIYGIMLYYGTGGAMLDEERGLSMIKSAASAGVVEAVEFLDYLNP